MFLISILNYYYISSCMVGSTKHASTLSSIRVHSAYLLLHSAIVAHEELFGSQLTHPHLIVLEL